MQVCAARGATPIFVMMPQATNLKHRSEPHSPTTSGGKRVCWRCWWVILKISRWFILISWRNMTKDMVKHETSCCSNQTNRKSKNIQSAKPWGDLAYGRLDIPDHEWMFIISTSNLLIVPVSPPSLSDYTYIYINTYLCMYVYFIYIYVACLIHISFASATIRSWRFHPCPHCHASKKWDTLLGQRPACFLSIKHLC